MALVRTVACPACSSLVVVSRSIFRLDFQCPHCDAALKVSPLYTRLVVLLGFFLGYALAWKVGMLGPPSCFFGVPWLFFLLCVPFAFLVLLPLVRIAPFLVRPTLVPRQSFESHLTTLNLSPGPKDDPQK